MSNIVRFGIPTLDELFGGKDPAGDAYGILLPGNIKHQSGASISICISGPDGTGKSVLGLHLASRYLADCIEHAGRREPPRVLYVSTDLKFKMAAKMWVNFGLDYPNLRTIPFTELKKKGRPDLSLKLHPCTPFGSEVAPEAGFVGEGNGQAEGSANRQQASSKAVGKKGLGQNGYSGGSVLAQVTLKSLSEHLVQSDAGSSGLGVYFIDLASHTAGDDWGYVNRVLSLLEKPGPQNPRHLVVLDSVEGFEVLVGDRDAFGEAQPRRSRIAQVMRSAAEKCHTVLIVEEPEQGKHLPEDFVTDVVIRLRSGMVKDYVRRTIELEKVRGHSHTRGQHSYLIRSGAGSSTGSQMNPDDPCVPAVIPPPTRRSDSVFFQALKTGGSE
jgi:KaiC/GvpD/RAD55 family RecA-like ATPase